MLPGDAALAAQDVGGTRLKDLFQDFGTFPDRFLDWPSTKLHDAIAEKRHTNNNIETRCIAMPSDRSSWRIIGHQHLRKFFRIANGEFSDPLPQFLQELRDRWCGSQCRGLI